jgi:polar amino acid transport system permease protein
VIDAALSARTGVGAGAKPTIGQTAFTKVEWWPYHQANHPIGQTTTGEAATPHRSPMRYELEFSAPLERWPDLLAGAATTLGLSVGATLFGFVLGVSCAIARTGHSRIVAVGAAAYVEAIRNTPLLVQIFIVYFGLASIGLKLGAFTAAIVALVVNVGAYTAEIVRAGIEAVPRSQREAAECLALGRWQLLRHVVLPPAIERVWPSLTSQYVLLMLASSITSQISAEELTAVANRVQSDTFRSVETYLLVAAAYLALSLLLRVLFWAAAAVAFPRRRRLGTPL